VPLCIIRPAIINPSYAEPFPGWVDSLAAAAVLFLFTGLGFVKVINGNPKKIGDVIPVDFVANNIILASAFNFRQKNLPIYHVGSSDRNPLTWG
jgi:fatty acyl-CoA reductase